jgi:hypothetical protein
MEIMGLTFRGWVEGEQVMKGMIAGALAGAVAMAAGGWSVPARAADQMRLGRSGSDSVFVWLDSDAQSEAIKLISAGVHETNPALVMRLLACIAKPGDHAVVTDGGVFSSTILVVDGDSAGCRGVIANEDLGG